MKPAGEEMESGARRTARRGHSLAQTFPAEIADSVWLHAAPSISWARSIVLGTCTLVQGDFGRQELEEAPGCDCVQHFWSFLRFPPLGPGLEDPGTLQAWCLPYFPVDLV